MICAVWTGVQTFALPISYVIKDDPPAHTRVRRLMDKAFTAHRVASLEPRITEIIVGFIEKLADKAANGEVVDGVKDFAVPLTISVIRSEEHTSELQSLMRISYAVFCLKKTNNIE